MGTPQHTHAQLSYPPSPPTVPTFDPATFVVDDIEPYDPNIFVDAIKYQIHTRIFATTQTPAPRAIIEALTDRVVSGYFKYHDPDTRQLRDAFHNVNYAQLQDTKPLLPLTKDAQPDQRFERALVSAISTYFRVHSVAQGLTAVDLRAIAGHAEKYLPQEHASAYITELVHIVFHSVSGDTTARASAVTKLVAGIPSSFTIPGVGSWDFIGRYESDSEVNLLYWQLLFSMVHNTISFEAQPIYSAPGSRWKLTLMAKVALWILAGSDSNTFDIASRLVDLDFAHNRIESGLALSHPILGSAIVAPYSAAGTILYAMAGCVQEREELQFEIKQGDDDDGLFQGLHDADKEINCNVLGIEVKEENMVSLSHYFLKGALINFFDSETWETTRVLISKNGIMLYLPKHQGPWVDLASSKGEGGRDPMKLVLRVLDGERSPEKTRKAIEDKSRRMQTDWLLDCPVSEETKRRFRYILNKPGRPLVRRRGIRGNYGRIIAAILLICGATVIWLNFAGRDNWLERTFDGAQVASLLAAVTVAIIFLLSGTLVDTLDLLAGKTEVQDIEQLCTLTGMTIEELQGVLTYARGTLYWLSEHRASYCRATKLGPIVMTPPLNVIQNPETKYSLVIDDRGDDLAGVWIMQGRLSSIEKSGAGDGTMRVEDIPFGSRMVRRVFGSDVALE